MGMSSVKLYNYFPSFALKMHFDVPFSSSLFEVREMLLTAWVSKKASCFTIKNDLVRTALGSSQQFHKNEGTCVSTVEELVSTGGGGTYCWSRACL